MERCDFGLVPCPNGCGAEFEKRFEEKHTSEDCPRRTLVCEFCSAKVCIFYTGNVISALHWPL